MGGILSEEDMAQYSIEVTEPLTFDYRGRRIYASSGLTGSPTAFETLGILQRLCEGGYAPEDPAYWGDLADALTLAWRDRFTILGDVPGIAEKIQELLSDEYARSQAELVRAGEVVQLPAGTDSSKETIHLSTCDADRNMVALTQTHGGGWGSRFGIPGLGIVLGHGMSRFDPRPGLPNSVGPWKEVLHNMSPLILALGDGSVAAVGLPGGRTIPSVVAEFVVDVVDFGMTPGRMLAVPRIHAEGAAIQVTDDLPDGARKEMERRGHRLKRMNAIGGLASGLVAGDHEIIGSARAGSEAALGI